MSLLFHRQMPLSTIRCLVINYWTNLNFDLMMALDQKLITKVITIHLERDMNV